MSADRSAADSHDPNWLAEWTEFHRQVETLPDAERAVADLIWNQGLPQEEVAALLGVDVRTGRRRWQRVRLILHRQLHAGPTDGRRTAPVGPPF